jgi:hypothetical protein
MSTTTTVLLVLLAVAVLAVLGWVYLRSRRAALKRRFGPEYERLVAEEGGKLRAEQELAERERMHRKLDTRPLSESSRRRFSSEWSEIQQLFVDDPRLALTRADSLVTNLLDERGYPTDDRRAQEATLSVEHAGVMDRYREAHEIRTLNDRGEASTEQLRRATVDYRSLVEQLLSADAPASARNGQEDK